ncbi:MAG: polyprenyl synthetase family protein [Solirubrobacterales bacterium]|nr:polyprenyl synthetase family protein [Solirubrobacterales bacterium]
MAGVEARLELYARATRAAMEQLLAAGPPAAYLDDLVADYPRRSGKGLRPALLLACCQAHAGALEEGLGPAVALELLHNSFLIHDDVEDATPTRRGAPALHEVHGVGLAVNAGDALAGLALQPLLDPGRLGSRLAREVVDEFLTMVRLTTAGQALELGWQRDGVTDLATDDYLRMVVRKTGWYTTVAPLRLGAVVGARGTAPLDALTRFGLHLGVAFQIRDDVLSIAGSHERHGKEHLGDIREGKRTLMLIHLLNAAAEPQRAEVVDYLRAPAPARTPAAAARVLELMHEHDSIMYANAYADRMTASALDLFDEAFAAASRPAPLRFIRDLLPYVVERST